MSGGRERWLFPRPPPPPGVRGRPGARRAQAGGLAPFPGSRRRPSPGPAGRRVGERGKVLRGVRPERKTPPQTPQRPQKAAAEMELESSGSGGKGGGVSPSHAVHRQAGGSGSCPSTPGCRSSPGLVVQDPEAEHPPAPGETSGAAFPACPNGPSKFSRKRPGGRQSPSRSPSSLFSARGSVPGAAALQPPLSARQPPLAALLSPLPAPGPPGFPRRDLAALGLRPLKVRQQLRAGAGGKAAPSWSNLSLAHQLPLNPAAFANIFDVLDALVQTLMPSCKEGFKIFICLGDGDRCCCQR